MDYLKLSLDAYKSGRQILDRALQEGRELTAEEQEQVEKAFQDSLNYKRQADLMEKGRQLETAFSVPVRSHPVGVEVTSIASGDVWGLVERHIRSRGVEFKADLTRYQDELGGYWLGVETSGAIISALDNLLWIRQRATVINAGTGKYSIPASSLAVTSYWVGDNTAVTPTSFTSPAGKAEFMPHPVAALVKVPIALLEDASFDLQAHIANRISWGLAEAQEQAFITGNGVQKPLGILNSGITGVSVETANSANITPKDLQSLPFNLKAQYRQRGAWLMNRTYVQKAMLLRDESGGSNTGRFLWQPSFQAGQPPLLAGFPVYETEYIGNPTANGDPIAIFGDFSAYVIVERREITVQVLSERYADALQVGILGYGRVDGGVVDTNAFVRLNATAGL